VTTADLATDPPSYAGLVRRTVAILLDLAIGWASYSVAITAFDPNVASEYATTSQTVLAALIVLATATLWLAYFVCAQWRWGQTLGMRAMGIRVVGDRNERLSWTRALVRSLLLLVDFAVGPLLIALSRRQQRLGDRLANTVVVMRADDSSLPPGTAAGVGEPPSLPTAGGAVPPPSGEEPAAAPPKVNATWGPGRVFVGILLVVVLSLIEVVIVSVFDPGIDTVGGKIISQLMLEATFVGVAFAVAADHGFPGSVPAVSLGLRRPLRSPWAYWGIAVLAYIAFILIYGSFVHPHQRDITRELGFGEGIGGAAVAFFLIVIAAAVAEEIFFRGFVFGGFRRRFSFPVAAVFAALLFGAIHASNGSWTIIPQLAFFGLLLCWVYEETGSIYSTIPLHMLNNTLAFIVIVS
jgi:membrane protease YdiL (CAAX protease family)/uncharacterized RDD family membrane protein YckC